jgi:hypothetical protein
MFAAGEMLAKTPYYSGQTTTAVVWRQVISDQIGTRINPNFPPPAAAHSDHELDHVAATPGARHSYQGAAHGSGFLPAPPCIHSLLGEPRA